MGLFLYRNRLIIVAQRTGAMEGHHFQKIRSLPDLVLRITLRVTLHYLEHLRIMNTIADELERKIVRAMENRHHHQPLRPGKELVYYQNAIHSTAW